MGRITQTLDVLSKAVSLVTWPVVLLVAVALFYSPMRRIAEVLPEKFEQSSEIGIGGLSVKIRERAAATGNVELAEIINGLSEEAIEWLLKFGDGSHRVIASNNGRDGQVSKYLYHPKPSWKELEAKGLLDADVPLKEYEEYFNSLGPTGREIEKNRLSKQQEDRLLANSVRLTDRGQRAYRIIIGVVADLISSRPYKTPRARINASDSG